MGSEMAISGNGIGAFKIGRSVDSLRNDCLVVQDTTILGEEALPEHVIAVAIGSDIIAATVDSGHVWRITIEAPNLRTADSLGVGSRLSDLLRDTDAVGAEGEGVLYVQLPSHCGLSFRLAYDVPDREHRENWSRRDLRRLPSTSKVQEVLITGCGGKGGR
jgi:hypothetical protein